MSVCNGVLYDHQIEHMLAEEIRKEQQLKDLFTLQEYTDIQELSNDEFFQGSNLKHFSYEWIVVATNNFSPVHKLGQGGFGSVYKVLFLFDNDGFMLQCMTSLLFGYHVLFGEVNYFDMILLGSNTRRTRSSYKTIIRKFKTRARGVQKRGGVDSKTPTYESCKVAWFLHSWQPKDAYL